MKTLIKILLNFLILTQVLSPQIQHIYSKKENAYVNYIKPTNQPAYPWAQGEHRVGFWTNNYIVANFNYWSWTQNIIPKEATVTSVNIKFRAYKPNHNHSFQFYFYNIPYKIDSGVNLYDQCTANNRVFTSEVYTPNSSYEVFVDLTVSSQSPVGNGWELWNAINNAVKSGNNYFTLGIKEASPSLYPTWNLVQYVNPINIYKPAIDLTINYTTPNNFHTFKNKIGSTENYGNLILNEIVEDPIPSGDTISLPWGSYNSIRTAELPFIVNWNNSNTTQKFNYWDLQSSMNHHLIRHTFLAKAFSVVEFKATFLPTSVQNIKNYSSELAANQNFGRIFLQDPWYIYKDANQIWQQTDEFEDYVSPLLTSNNSITSYGGVFLNQGITPQGQWQPSYYSVKADYLQTFNLSQTGRTHNFYFQGWSASPQGSAEFKYTDSLETPVVFKQENATVQANYKGTQISSTIDGFKNNGQRKFIITSYPQAYYHLVYTSMGGVWYEKALVNYDVLSPVDWQLMNNQKALNNLPNQEAKSPSIDYVYATQNLNEENYFIYIVYQNKKQDGKYEIRLAKFNQGGTKLFDISVYQSSTIDYNSIDCTPVVAVSKQVTESYPIKLIVLWKRPTEGTASAGLYYLAGFDRGNYIEWKEDYPIPKKIPTTDVNSLNPTIAAFKKPNEAIYYHLAYQQGNSDIKYCYVVFGVDGTTAQNPITVSGGSGSYTNICPSITVGNTSSTGSINYDSPKIVWNADGAVIYRYRTNMTTTKWSPMYMYIENDEAQSPSISGPKYHPNGFDDEYYFGWSWLEGYYKSYVSTENLSQKRQMAYRGKDLQLATVGGGWEGFGYVVLDNFTRTTAPIVFENKWIDAQLGKIASNISAGRSGTVIKNNAEFYFAFGDIKLNDNTINFNQLNDTTVIESIDDLNESLKSEPIAITDNDILTYSVFYGLKDSAAAFNNLTNDDYIRFTVEIIDVNTQQVLSSLDDVQQRKQSLIEYENLSYQISMQGIGQREIILRLKVQTNLNTDCELANIYSFNKAVSKGRIKQMKWNDETLPKEFVLEQNYPNPFNPTTVISWQSPVGGHQTLKIYDILGNEVATLIDEYKEAGRYKLEYDASNLASGVYIYKLTAGNYVSSKKMMVIK